jgi:hypothetical protein
VDLVQVWGNGGRGGAQSQGKRDQSLLGPVVQVAFDPASRSVGGGDDARA